MRAPADGYTLLLVSTASAINTTLFESKLNYNFLRDIVPIAGIFRVPNVMVVHPSVPAKTVPEFIAYAKANPGKINVESPGTGTSSHLAGELFKLMTGVDMVHIQYRGNGPALIDLLAGQGNTPHCFPRSADDMRSFEWSASRHFGPGSVWEAR